MRIRKFLSIMLVICLVATLMPVSQVNAAESEFTYEYEAVGNTGAVITVTSGQSVTATANEGSSATVSVEDSAVTVTAGEDADAEIVEVSIDYGEDEPCVVEVPLGYTTFVFDGDNLTVYEGSDTEYAISGVNAADNAATPAGTLQEDGGTLYTNAEDYSLSVDIKKKGGTYVFTGETDDMSITVKKEATNPAVLLLASLTLKSEITSPIAVKKDSTSTVEIKALAGHTNYLEDAELNDADTYGATADGGDNTNPEYAESAVIKCKTSAKVTIDGSGTLELNCVTKNAIKVGQSGSLTIKDLTLNVTSAGNGISSDNTMNIESGTINVVAKSDGIRSDPDEGTNDAGTITISGGTISIDAGSDGIQAAGDISVSGGVIDIDAEGDGLKSTAETGSVSLTGGTATIWSAEAAEDSTNVTVNCSSLTVSGATVFAAGSGMTATISESSQAYVASSGEIASGQTISVTYDGAIVYTTSAVKDVDYVFYSAPDLEAAKLAVEAAEAVSLNISEVDAPVATTITTYGDAGGIEALTDGDESTIYHSMYGSEMESDPDNALQYDTEKSADYTAVLTGNNELVFTLSTTATVSEFNYLTKTGNGAILSYEIYVAGEDEAYTQVASGTWANSDAWKYVTFDPVAGVKYVKLVAKETYTTELDDGYVFIAGKEIQVIGVSDCKCSISGMDSLEDIIEDVDFESEGSYTWSLDDYTISGTRCSLHGDEQLSLACTVDSKGATGATVGDDGVTFTAIGTATLTVTATLAETTVTKTISVTLTDSVALAKAKSALEEVVEDADELLAAIDEADYTEDSYSALESAYISAAALLESEDASAADLTAAATALQSAMDGLVTMVDYWRTALSALLNTAADVENDKDSYTDDSYATFEAALAAANTAYDNGDATADELETAYNSLNKAIEALVTQESVDKAAAQDELSSAVDSCEATYSAGQGNYTDDTWNEFVASYDAAKTALSNPDAYTSDELNTLLSNLSKAQTALATAAGTDSSSADAAATSGTTATTSGTAATAATTATADTTPQKGETVASGYYYYKVTGDDTVEVTGLTAKGKKQKKLKIFNSVKLGSTTFKVTSIAKNAIKGNTKVTTVIIGKNVTSIGAKAFYGCKKLKKVTIKSKVLKSVGKAAFKGVSSKVTVKVPKAKKTAYTKLLKKGGVKAARIK